MIRTASPADLPALRELFARSNDAPYDLAAVAEEKCFGRGISGDPVVRIVQQNGKLAAAAVTSGKWLRILSVDRDARRRGIGSALLEDAESHGASVIAAEPGNYFTPGVPLSDTASREFFRARGYVEMRAAHNLDSPIPVAPPPRDVRRPSREEADRVLEFVEREFGSIWRFEAAKAFDREEPTAVISEADGEVTGFAVHDVNNRGLGFFGPTGVAKSMRGRGIGCRLLLASLADLRRLGYVRAVIPWTDALDFYRLCSGAEPAHRFIAFAKAQP